MMHPMQRMFGIGIVCGFGLCNILWIIVDFNHISFILILASAIVLFVLWRDSIEYYQGVK